MYLMDIRTSAHLRLKRSIIMSLKLDRDQQRDRSKRSPWRCFRRL